MRGRLNPRQVTELVTVRTHTGQTSYGDTYGEESPPVRCQLEGGTRLVQTATGEQVTAASTLRIPPDPGLDIEAAFTVGSLVRVRGRDTTLLTAAPVLNRGRLVFVEATLA